MRNLRVGLIGCGRIVEVSHAPAYGQCSDLMQVVAVADPCSARRLKVAGLLNLPQSSAFAHTRDMIASSELDVVVVAVPPGQRFSAISQAASAKCAIICEKPLAVGRLEAMKIRRVVENAGVKFAILHNYQYRAAWIEIFSLIRKGAIGVPQTFSSMELTSAPWPTATSSTWREASSGGGPLWENAYHSFYLSERILGELNEGWAVNGSADPAGRQSCVSLIRHAKGGLSSVICSWADGGGPTAEVTISGTDGTIAYSPWAAPNCIRLRRAGGEHAIRLEAFSTFDEWGHLGAFKACLRAIREGVGDYPNLADAYRIAAFIDACRATTLLKEPLE